MESCKEFGDFQRLRLGFKHKGVRVLPRQTCGLFTKNLFYLEYPGGPEVLESSIHGGELFQTVVYNRVSVFMTHMPNYVEDRLAPYALESVVHMLKCWTNLELRTRNPRELADIYFKMYPEENTAIWGNPCDDRRHMEIWSGSKSCDRLPDLLIVGPQKTGTSALHKFLKMHPAVATSVQSPTTFEEVQFFSGPNYEKGIDWYMDFFPSKSSRISPANQTSPSSFFLFEKSATYFDRDVVPKRARRLLPKARILVVLISPAKRAYSWYQHQRAHDDQTALEHTFHEVITADPGSASRALRNLQSRCLEPGKYAQHLERWLTQYKPRHLHIVDGEELKFNPVSVMHQLQHSLDIQPFQNYSKMIEYSRKKGYYCPVVGNRIKCLGKGKGRPYKPMKPESQKYLNDYYRNGRSIRQIELFNTKF